MIDDPELLRRYGEERDEGAFAELVRRHVDFVYSAALRQLNGDGHLAADATQLVFTDLARKASSLARQPVLAGWLFTSTRFATSKIVRGEQRRRDREQEAQLMQASTYDDPAAQLDWERVRPVLDAALGELAETEREAILLRFFEGCDYARVGARLRVADNTARMRVERALDKLRLRLQRRGVTSTSAALALTLATQAVTPAPVGLAGTITGAALVGAGGAAGAAAAAGFMSMTKLQLGLSGALAVASTTGFVVQANTNAQLRDEVARLRVDTAAVSSLQHKNQALARSVAEVADMRGDDAQFAQLQQEASALRTQLQQVARAEAARETAARGAMAEVYDIAKLDRQPQPRFQARPQYPFEMRRAGTTGEVVVDFIVDVNGDVQKAFAVRSSQREFEAAAVQAVSKWKFNAGQKGGRAVGTHLQVPIVFSLSGESQKTAAGAPRSETGGAAAPAVQLTPFVTQSTRP